MTLGYDYPVARLAEPRTVRLVSTKRLEDPVLKRLVSTEQRLRDLEEIDGATSGRLSSQRQGSDDRKHGGIHQNEALEVQLSMGCQHIPTFLGMLR